MAVAGSIFNIFQFLEGAIKGKEKMRYAAHFSPFQFLEGAIKGSPYMNTVVVPTKFQFLEGAIKGTFADNSIGEVRLFQFLEGAIKGLVSAFMIPSFIYFNSSKVRLKVVEAMAADGLSYISIPRRCD